MPLEVRVPEVSEGIHQGIVVAIAVAVGDKVAAEQTLLELETDKAVVAIPSPEAGTVAEIKVKEGDEVAIGAVIMVLDAAEPPPQGEAAAKEQAAGKGEAAPGAKEQAAGKGEAAPGAKDQAEEIGEPAPAGKEQAAAKEEPAPPEQPEPEARAEPSLGRRGELVAPAAPSVRRQARELGVDIHQVQGSGPGGRIGEADVRGFVAQTMQRITGGGGQPRVVGEFPGLHAQRPLPDFSRFGEIRREPLSRVRELTADVMSYAWSTIPMVTQYDQARLTEIEAFRREFNATVEAAAKLTVTAILVKICGAALQAFPRFNSSLDLAGRELILKQYVHMGVAVDTPQGLLVPVLRQVEGKGIKQLAVELNELAARARQRKLRPAEMEGGSFTLSNLGGIGGHAFTPLVYAPQVAILGVSRAARQPVWDGQAFVPELMLPLALSYDHRVVDGADGARFLRWICAALENPLLLEMKG